MPDNCNWIKDPYRCLFVCKTCGKVMRFGFGLEFWIDAAKDCQWQENKKEK